MFHPPVNSNVANQFDNYDVNKFNEHFWLSKTDVKCLIDEITVQLYMYIVHAFVFIIHYWLWWPLWLHVAQAEHIAVAVITDHNSTISAHHQRQLLM